MMRTKYVTIQEVVSHDRNKLVGTKILVLSEQVINTMLKAGIFRLRQRQVWYGNVPVFMDSPIGIPEDVSFINTRKIELKDLKDFR